jgi:hypothetical protein
MMIKTVTAGGTTFKVADVEPATKPLPQVRYKEAIEGLLRAERLAKETDYRPIEAWTRPTGWLLEDIYYHPLVTALCCAYAGHRPISLSPDMIWLLICQGVARHISANTEDLRRHFVRHDGKLALSVRRDDFDKGSPDNPWSEVFDEFSAQIMDRIGPKHALFTAAFSTTGPAEKAASEIVLLDAMQNYFHYRLEIYICGIPAITLEGTPADWQSILDRTEAFAPLGMAWWLSRLRPILRQFHAAAQGKIDRAFWRSIYRIYEPDKPCSASSAMGWINLFFPYLLDEEDLPRRRNPWLTGERDLDELLAPPPKESDRGYVYHSLYPSGLAKAPFAWEVHDGEGNRLNRWDMEFLGGFVGIAQDPESLCLRPEIGWAVREAC